MCSSDDLSVLSRKVSELWFLLYVCVMKFLMGFFSHLQFVMHYLCKCLVAYPLTVMLKMLKADGISNGEEGKTVKALFQNSVPWAALHQC